MEEVMEFEELKRVRTLHEDRRMGRLNTFFAPHGLHLPTIRIILLKKVSLTFLGEKM